MKEFKLDDKREQLFLDLCNKEQDVAWIIQVIKKQIEEQDKEFIRLLKEELSNELFKLEKSIKMWKDYTKNKKDRSEMLEVSKIKEVEFNYKVEFYNLMGEKIDKLAGSELSGDEK